MCVREILLSETICNNCWFYQPSTLAVYWGMIFLQHMSFGTWRLVQVDSEALRGNLELWSRDAGLGPELRRISDRKVVAYGSMSPDWV